MADGPDRAPLADADPVPAFPIALRGYDRAAVHAFAVETLREVRALRRELAGLLDRSTAAEAQLAAVQRENHTLREGYASLTRGTTVPTGTGARVERLLQAAEEEAAALRATAVREATRLLEQAREQADAHVRAAADEAAQQRAARDGESRRREAQVRADEQRAADRLRDRLAAAERERDAAEERARELAADADVEADAIRAGARAEAARLVEQARAEADRLAAVGRSAREDLARLLTVITTGLPDRTGAGAPEGGAGADPGTAAAADATRPPDDPATVRLPHPAPAR